ncbi:MAG: GFA family protein [Sphingomonas bacterium]|nr:GFA family protein [Sphingomonas bacterium]
MSILPEMKLPIIGSCLCGQVTYTCSKSPFWSVNCHCRSCQKLSGAPYVSAFSVPADSFRVTGQTVDFRRLAEAGHEVTTTHCAACGSRVHAQSAGATHLMNVFASTLADPSGYLPISNVYLSEAAHWIEPPQAKFNFAKMPRA